MALAECPAEHDEEPLLCTERLDVVRSAPERRCWGRLAGAALAIGGLAGAALVVLDLRLKAQAPAQKFRRPFRLYEGGLPMPDRSDQYDGIGEARQVTISPDQDGVTQVFAMGDWGATLPDHMTFAGGGTDDWRQYEVATAVKDRASWAKPQYVLNVGDNFYVDGLPTSCNARPDDQQGWTASSYSSVWQGMYGDVANIPWLSCLGNHDYGGWRFDKGWPQQIGYSFMNHNWIMPARYYMKRMDHHTYSVDYFVIDTNAWDAFHIGEPGRNQEHNICSQNNYGGGGTCAANGGMDSIDGCTDWFWNSYAVQKQWLEEKIRGSDARWKIVVTHFPCGYDSGYFKMLKANYGLDLLVTGHRHQQELWKPDTASSYIQSVMQQNQWDGSSPACFVTGGGGGITSEDFSYADYGTDLQNYGFFHLSMHQDWLRIELVGLDGAVHGTQTIHPH